MSTTILELIHSVFPDEISLSPAQTAKILNCHVRSVNRGLVDGSLPLPTFTSTTHRQRVLVTDLVAYLEKRTACSAKKRGRPLIAVTSRVKKCLMPEKVQPACLMDRREAGSGWDSLNKFKLLYLYN